MVSSYVRIRSPLEDVMARYGRWIERAEVAPARIVRERDMIDLALVDGDWRGLAVWVFASGEWTIIEELSGGLSSTSAERWLEFAQGGDLVYAGYNDTIPYAELVVVSRGRLVRQVLKDEQDPSEDVDVGKLPEESKEPFVEWFDVMAWVEADEDTFERPDEGWLWIHRGESFDG